MAAQSLNCPNCGAAASSEATRCEHCNSRLATVACPACFGMIFQGAKYCSHCGMAVQRVETPAEAERHCPRCRVNTKDVLLGTTRLRECPVCEGLWVDNVALHRICTERERQSAILGTVAELPAGNVPLERVRYVPCPVCRQLMHRVNFAKCSNVIVDVCKPHGTWFDKDELHRIVKFITAGGFDRARAVEIAELQRQRAALESARTAAAQDRMTSQSSYGHSGESALTAAAEALIGSLFD
jgi:Zn-finger nucleic acid-binding protein